MSTATLRIISADCHINEPPWVFDRVPAEYRDRTPKLMRGVDGGDGWSFDGKPPKRTFGVEAWQEKGVRTGISRISMASTSLGLHILDVGEGTYATAHRHGAGPRV